MLTYRLLLTLLSPVLLGLLVWRVLRGQETREHLAMRLGLGKPQIAGPQIWLHAASNGELAAAETLIREISARWPETALLITCNSVTGLEMARGWALPKSESRLAPLDTRWAHANLLRGRSLSGHVLFEGDFWPNRQRAAALNAPWTALIAGRISQKSAKIWQKWPRVALPLFTSFDLVLPQDTGSRERLKQIGTRAEVMGPVSELKSSYTATPLSHNLPFVRSHTWLAASTHEGEDFLLLTAHCRVRAADPKHRLIIAPRHPKRGPAIAQTARDLGLKTHLLSTDRAVPKDTEVLVANTLGEMARWYEAAHLCFVAGSLTPKGGHTPFEPIAHGCAILHGPHVDTFQEIYARLDTAGASLALSTDRDIAEALIKGDSAQKNALAQKIARDFLVEHGDLHLVISRLEDLRS